LLWAAIVYFAASLTDWYDGYIARRFNLVTRWGQFMDPLADKLLVSSALIVFAHEDYIYWWMVWIIIGRDFIITFLRIFALYIGKPIITSMFARWKTFIQMVFTFAFLIYINIPGLQDIHLSRTEHPWYLWTNLMLTVVVLLTLFSGIQYLWANFSHVSELFRRAGKFFVRNSQKD